MIQIADKIKITTMGNVKQTFMIPMISYYFATQEISSWGIVASLLIITFNFPHKWAGLSGTMPFMKIPDVFEFGESFT